jgi:Hemerythrin HHE cation binding domain
LDQSDREVDEMILLDLGWSAPARPVDAGAAGRYVLQQHEWIRVLLGRGSAVAKARFEGVASGDSVAAAIGEFRSAMIAHVAFEEAALLPMLRDDLPVGAQRADRLHARQRDMLDKIFEEARARPDLHTLAAKLAFLTEWLYADMLEEERSLLNPDVVRDDPIVIDQTCG